MEKLIIPLEPVIRIPEVTGVPLPEVLDLCDSVMVQRLVSLLVEEEVAANPDYLGVLLFGSVTCSRSRNTSDIDLVHVVRGVESAADNFRERLARIFYAGYGVDVHDVDNLVWSLGENVKDFASLLNCYTKPLIPDTEVREQVIEQLGFTDKPKCAVKKDTDGRNGKKDFPHHLNLQAMRNFNYGKHLKQLEDRRMAALFFASMGV